MVKNQLTKSTSWRNKQKAKILGKATANLDKEIRRLLDCGQTRYRLKEDADKFHQVSGHYYCTHVFLTHYLALLVQPETAWRVASALQHGVGEVPLAAPRKWFTHTPCRTYPDSATNQQNQETVPQECQ